MHEALLTELRNALRDRFEIKREIGEGVYGTVFLAADVDGRPVALKVLRPEILVTADYARIPRELGAISKLNHPNLLPVLASGTAANCIYYSTPFIDGGSLRERLDREGPLPSSDALRIAQEVADALGYALSHGVIHRDITPRHVLFDSGRAIVKEFWIARALARALSGRLTASGLVMGTPEYMSPEQIMGAHTIDSQSDVYSLAVLICEMLTKQLPFTGKPMEIVARQLAGPSPSRGDLPSSLPPHIAEALVRALARAPRDRFATAQELVDACLAGTPDERRVGAGAFGARVHSRSHRSTYQTATFVGILGAGILLIPTVALPTGALPWLSPTVQYGIGVGGLALSIAGIILRRRHFGARSAPARGEVRVARDPTERLRAALRYQYELGHEVARGGMALVYVAHDLRYRRRRVALKVLRPELSVSLASERFLEEIQITAQLSHPGILPVLDSGDADGMHFYVMPYVEGETLKARVDREGRLSVADALTVTHDVARALDYAHRQQIVHRDIKPENILLHEGQAIVADFGIALALDRARDRRTTKGNSIGTPEFMSPEQFWDTAHIDHRSDLYSLGCVLYEMLAGTPPYAGTAQELAAKHLNDPIPHITSLRSDVSVAVDAAIQKVLAKKREDRFQSARAFMMALVA